MKLSAREPAVEEYEYVESSSSEEEQEEEEDEFPGKEKLLLHVDIFFLWLLPTIGEILDFFKNFLNYYTSMLKVLEIIIRFLIFSSILWMQRCYFSSIGQTENVK